VTTVLVVDDDPVFSEVLIGFLGSRGYETVSAPDTIAALDLLESKRPIDLAILDVVMPPGLPHGVALAAMANLRRQGLPVIFVTGSPDMARQFTSDQPVFAKPVDLEALHVAIRASLGE
jgi:CheY-like chemotaxis protein